MPRQPAPKSSSATPAKDKVQESAQQIWLAGLGAFAKAQAEGGKVFEALVKDGLSMQRTTQAAAEEKIAEAAKKFSSLAGGLAAPVAQPWDRLETIFEDRVAKALGRLGAPSRSDWHQLLARLEALEARAQAAEQPGDRPQAPKTPKRAKTPAQRAAGPATKATPRPAAKRSIAKRG